MSEQPPDAPPWPETPAPQPPAAAVPVEDPAVGFASGLVRTIALFVANPREGFARVTGAGTIVRPVAYYLILGWVATAIGQVYQLVLGNPLTRFLPAEMQEQAVSTSAMTVASLIVAPVILAIVMLFWSAVFHGMLSLLGAAGAPFPATLRVVCYAGTAQLAQVVPLCGGIAGVVWSIVLWVLGLMAVHRATAGKATIAVGAPLLLCCACVAVLWFAVVAGLLAAGSGGF